MATARKIRSEAMSVKDDRSWPRSISAGFLAGLLGGELFLAVGFLKTGADLFVTTPSRWDAVFVVVRSVGIYGLIFAVLGAGLTVASRAARLPVFEGQITVPPRPSEDRPKEPGAELEDARAAGLDADVVDPPARVGDRSVRCDGSRLVGALFLFPPEPATPKPDTLAP